jgi:phage/plasmid-associated DNA primase
MLPGILNWSVEGWKRLQARDRFEEPTPSKEAERIVAALPDRQRIRRVVVEYL